MEMLILRHAEHEFVRDSRHGILAFTFNAIGEAERHYLLMRVNHMWLNLSETAIKALGPYSLRS